MGFIKDVALTLVTGGAYLQVKAAIEAGKQGAKAYDEVTGARASRDAQAEQMKKMDAANNQKIAEENLKLVESENVKQRQIASEAETARANRPKQEQQTTRRSTIVTGPLGITQPYRGNRRSILGG